MDDNQYKYFLGLKDEGYSDSEIRKKIREILGVKKTKGNQIFNYLFGANNKSACLEKKPVAKQAKAFFRKNDGEAESISPDIRTLDQLLEVCKVDLDTWEVEKYIVNKWATARSNKTPNITFRDGKIDGVIEDNGGMSVTPLFQVKAWLKKKTAYINAKAIFKEFVEKAAQNAPAACSFETPKLKIPNDNLLEISVPDIHLAKLCWGKETKGRDYNIAIAAEDYKKAVGDLFHRVRGSIGRVLLPIGNDMFNSDNIAGTTTKGTPQANSEDSRWPKTFMVGCQILVDVITQLAKEVYVDVIIVPGNHDKERSFYLGEYLKAWFRNHSFVNINNEPTQRKYYRWGVNLIGFTHGSEEKPEKLPLLMANEEKQAWSETKFRQWHLGHLHHEIMRDIQGVIVHFLPSICPPDEWHATRGYVGSIQAAEAFLYNVNDGLTARYYHNI